ncbi:MAG: hypothetical protein ACLTTR_03190 [Clostridia bacterium]|jgi:hypothetical protein|nr:hypothetical protein [Clostridium sp.]MBS5863378.1 hypothetical protein [Clostridium sp.]
MVKKNERRKNNLRYSLLLLLLLLVFLMVSTYAWFTANQTVTISTLDVNVQTSNGLQISADAINWKTILQKADITGASATYTSSVNQVPDEMQPVSSAGIVDTDTGYMDMYFGTVDALDDGTGYSLASDKEVDTRGAEGRYIAFDIFLRVDQTTPVYLTTASNIITKEGAADKGLQNAARVAFIDEGNIADVGDSTGAQALKGGTTSIIWEPNYDVHTAAGVANAKEIYGLDTTTTGATQLSYQGIKAEFADTEGVTLKNTNTFSQYFQTVTPTISTVKDFDTQQTLLNLKAGITKVRIYMWVEGQDVDCENNASGTDISFNVQITKATE